MLSYRPNWVFYVDVSHMWLDWVFPVFPNWWRVMWRKSSHDIEWWLCPFTILMLLLSTSSLRGVFGGHDERVWPPTVEQMINTVPRNPYNLFYTLNDYHVTEVVHQDPTKQWKFWKLMRHWDALNYVHYCWPRYECGNLILWFYLRNWSRFWSFACTILCFITNHSEHRSFHRRQIRNSRGWHNI